MATFELKIGDILLDQSEALVNPVNCVGVSGSGLALQFKQKFPENFRAYAHACRQGEVLPGRLFVFEISKLPATKYIINFPTKRHWRDLSLMSDIEDGLTALAREIENRYITSIAIPPLGAGLGKLPWQEVVKRIYRTLKDIKHVHVVIYMPI